MKARATTIILAQLFGACLAYGQENPFNPKHTIVPITTLRLYVGSGVGAGFNAGTGFCLDVKCEVIGTNYHVAVRSGTFLKIKGQRVIQRYLASGPQDEGAMTCPPKTSPFKS